MKNVLILVAVGVVVSIALAEEVRTVNTAGLHKHTVDPGDLILVAPTVDNLEGNQLSDVLGDQLPNNSAVFIWNGLGYDPPATKSALGGWTPNYTVIRGQAIFVQNAASASGPVTFGFTGELPEARNGGGTTTVSVSGLDAIAYPYKIDIEFGTTQTAIDAPLNSAVFFWNVGSQAYDPPSTKQALGGWGAASVRVVGIGEAFFMEAPSPFSSDEVQPYNLDV